MKEGKGSLRKERVYGRMMEERGREVGRGREGESHGYRDR